MVKIFVGRLAPCVSSSQLRELFEEYGPVSDCDILTDYGFVHMSHEADAQRAIKALDRYDLYGSRLSVELSTSRSMKSCQLIVKNLPKGVALEDLHKLFKKFGTVTLCKINNDNAIVHMRFPSMATTAVRNLSGETFRGNVLSVEFLNNANKQINEWTNQPRALSSNNFLFSEAERSSFVATTSNSISRPFIQGQSSLIMNQAKSDTSTVKNTADHREKRRLRIKHGLRFLQSSMPWNGTTELYKTFLNQLKVMLLEEGLELFREGSSEDAVIQISEAINISNYMKMEGIQGHLDIQDRLFLERAVIKLHMGNPTEALRDAEEAFNITHGNDQNIIRLKARLLAQCGRWDEAFAFMVKCQQVQNLDTESIHLMDLLKQTITSKLNASNRLVSSKGTIGDGRGRSVLQPNLSAAMNSFTEQKNLQLNQNVNGTGSGNKEAPPTAFSQQYSNFNGTYNSPIQNLLAMKGNLPIRDLSRLSLYNNHNYAPANTVAQSVVPCVSSVAKENTFPGNSLLTRPPTVSSAMFDSAQRPPAPNVNDSAYFPPSSYRQLPSTTASGMNSSYWNGRASIDSGLGKSASSLDNELALAMENKMNATIFNNLPFSSLHKSWSNKGDIANTCAESTIPVYSHFSSDPSKGGYTGSVLGPAMLGINTARPGTTKLVAAPSQSNGILKTPASVARGNVQSAIDLLKDIFQPPLFDTHDFKLGCVDCVIPSGTKLLDCRYDDSLVHMCAKKVLLCRRRGNTSWFKVRARSPAASSDSYALCKELVTVKGCVQADLCAFAHNKEEVFLWTLEHKGYLNRTWLYKSLDPLFVQSQSLVDLVALKYGGRFEMLCKACYQSKPRVISRFVGGQEKCTHPRSPHPNSPDNQQLIHVIRDDTVRYREVRDAQQLMLCGRAAIFQCAAGSACGFAHSPIERDAWVVMTKESLSASEFYRALNKQFILDNNASDSKPTKLESSSLEEIRRRMKFICSSCYKNGQCIEVSKDMKCCSSRARHALSTTGKVALFFTQKKTWTQIRDLPYLKTKALPLRFELCESFIRQQSCAFGGKCAFAHSQEEMDVWLLMREKQIEDLDRLYDMIVSENQGSNDLDGNRDLTKSVYHCWLCDEECADHEWEEHCSSEPHIKRATADADHLWKFRKPGGSFEICQNHLKGICEFGNVFKLENTCPYAHSPDELKEWDERRQYIVNRVLKAREDRLLESSTPNSVFSQSL